MEKLLPVCIYGNPYLPLEALATSYPGALLPAAVAPILTRAGVRLLRQADTTFPSHTLKKRPAQRRAPPPCTPITAAQLAYYVTKLPATTTH